MDAITHPFNSGLIQQVTTCIKNYTPLFYMDVITYAEINQQWLSPLTFYV